MASTQQVSNAAQLNDHEKAKINEALKEAESFLASQPNATAVQNQFAMVAGAMKNGVPRVIELMNLHFYKGEFVADPPCAILPLGSGAFMSQGAARYDGNIPVIVGTKAAIIYCNNEWNKPNKYGWLLAYDKPADSNAPNKVYVEAGFRERLMKIHMSEIEKNLDASGPVSRFCDSETGATAIATIQDKGDNLAVVGAKFDLN